MEIYLIRHGETEWNTLRKLQGRSDTELNEVGVQLAQMTAEALKDIPFDVIYTSPLKRAKKTAEIIKGDRKIPLIEDARIQEVCFGDYEGLGCAKENYEIPDPEFEYFFQEPDKYVAKNGCESIEALCERTTSFLKEILSDKEFRDKRILISTHGAAMKGILSIFHEGEKENFWGCGVHRNCAVTKLTYEGRELNLEYENRIFYPEHLGTKPRFAKHS